MTYTTHVSYLEIYNENGYDLLDPNHEAAKLEDLPYVINLYCIVNREIIFFINVLLYKNFSSKFF